MTDLQVSPGIRHARTAVAAAFIISGLAFASRKDLGQALAERDKLAVEAEKAKGLQMGNNTGATVFAVAGHMLDGKILAARGDAAGARAELEKAVKAYDELAYDEPTAFPWPAREALGAQLLRSGDAAAAERVFRDDLAKTLNNPRSLYGLSESLKARGKHYEAGEVSKQFAERWQGADVTLRIEDF